MCEPLTPAEAAVSAAFKRAFPQVAAGPGVGIVEQDGKVWVTVPSKILPQVVGFQVPGYCVYVISNQFASE